MGRDATGQSRRVAVIGAGAAGLCSAKHLLEKKITPVIFEIGTQIGGLWVYENDSGMSPAYRSLHVNSETRVTAYKDFPFPENGPIYPNHWQMTEYLRGYAARFGLERHIRFRSRVSKVEPLPDGGYRLTIEGQAPERFDAVVVACGHQSAPTHPPFSRDFTGDYIHAHSYRVPEPYRDKRVVVVGVGNSACDIAADIWTGTKSTTIAARSPVLIMPRVLFGKPISRFLARVEKPWLPWPVRRRIREVITWAVHGRMEQWGFRTPKSKTHPSSHPSLMAHFVWNRITAKPGIAKIEGQRVTFDDGSVQEFDAMIAATGYDVSLPFLSPALNPVNGRWLDLFLRVLRPGQPGLYFVGFFNVAGGGNIRMMDDQAEWVAAIEAGEVGIPSLAEQQRGIEAERALINANYPDRPRYGLELEPVWYRKALALAMAASRVSPERGTKHTAVPDSTAPSRQNG